MFGQSAHVLANGNSFFVIVGVRNPHLALIWRHFAPVTMWQQ